MSPTSEDYNRECDDIDEYIKNKIKEYSRKKKLNKFEKLNVPSINCGDKK